MAWSTLVTNVTASMTLVYTAPASAVTARITASSSVRVGESPVVAGVPLDPGDTLTLSLGAADEVYAKAISRPGIGDPSPDTATVYVAAGP